MAIYSLTTKPIGRRNGRSATAAAAYRSSERIYDERTGEIHDYSRKRGVIHSEIIAPEESPDWVKKREKLWNAAESAEKRKDSRVAREYHVALPSELSREQQIELTREFSAELVDRYGVAADINIHKPSQQGDQRNYHAHILVTTRNVSTDGFADKTDIEKSDKKLKELGQAKGSAQVEHWRERWEKLANKSLERNGHSERIDRRSHEDRGLKEAPTKHLGPKATELERRGQRTEIGDFNRRVIEFNKKVRSLAKRQEEIRKLNEKRRAEFDRLPADEKIIKLDEEHDRLKELANNKHQTLKPYIEQSKKPIDDIATRQRKDPTYLAASDVEKKREQQRLIAKQNWDEYKQDGGYFTKQRAAFTEQGYSFGEVKKVYSKYQNADFEYQQAKQNRIQTMAYLNSPEMRQQFETQMRREETLKQSATKTVDKGLREIDGLERRADLIAKASDRLKIDENRKGDQWNKEQIKKAKSLQARMRGVSRKLDGLNSKQSGLKQQLASLSELTPEEAVKRMPEYREVYDQINTLSAKHMSSQKDWGLYEIEHPKQAKAVKAGLMGRFFKEGYEIQGRMKDTLKLKTEAQKHLKSVQVELLKPENRGRVEAVIQAQSGHKAGLEKQLLEYEKETKRLDGFYQKLHQERRTVEGQKARGGWILNEARRSHSVRWSRYNQGQKGLPSRQEKTISDLQRSMQRERSRGLPPMRGR